VGREYENIGSAIALVLKRSHIKAIENKIKIIKFRRVNHE